MDYDPKQIVAKFEEFTKAALLEVHSGWWSQYKFNTNRLKSILNSLKIDLAQSEKWKENPERFWSDMRLLISRLQQWLGSLQFVEHETDFDQLLAGFHRQFNQQLHELPSEIRILIGDFYWQTNSSEKFYIRIRKKMKPIRYKVDKFSLKLKNLIRALLQKPPVKRDSDSRIIKLHEFLTMYLAQPFSSFVKEEWTLYLKTVIGQYLIIQGKSADLLDIMLMRKRIEKIINSDSENIFDSLYAMAEILKEIDIIFESINEYQKRLPERFEKFWEEMQTDLNHAWDRAGTFQLPTKRYSPEEYQAKIYRQESRHKRDLQLWQKQVAGLLGEWQKNLSLAQLGLNSSVAVMQGVRSFNENISKKIKPELSTTQRQIDRMILRVERIDTAKELKTYYDQKLDEFALAKFSQLLDTVSTAHLPGLINQVLDTIKFFKSDLPESTDIFLQRDTSNIPPRSKVRSIDLNRLVSFTAYIPCETTCLELHDIILEKQDEIYRNISQLGRMIEFQFESAIQLIAEQELDERIDEAKLIIRDTLAKAELQISKINTEIEDILETLKQHLPENLSIFCSKLVDLFSSEVVIGENISLVKDHKKRTRNVFVRKTINFTKNVTVTLVKKPANYFLYIFRTYFLHVPVHHNRLEIISIQDSVSRFLRETTDKISQLPYIYRKLFLFSPLTSSRFYSARRFEFDALHEEFDRWNNDAAGMVALIGELGSGKTTLLNMAKEEIFKPLPVIHMNSQNTLLNEEELSNFLARHFKMKKMPLLKDLIRALANKPKLRICILENLNLLFTKSVRGMELMEQLMGFMIQTQQHIFWVVTCSSYSWQYLRKTIKAEKYFHRLITLGEFSNGDIKAIIMNRHRLSGYDLMFESNGNLIQNKKLKKIQSEDHRQEFLNKQYFHKLNEISAGNVSVAMLYWLRSINSIQDDRVVLGASIDFNYEFLKDLSQTELFTLAAIVNFDKISITDHAHIFNQSVEQSDLHLNQMRRYGILVEQDEKYLIHPFLYRHLVELLKSKNILH